MTTTFNPYGGDANVHQVPNYEIPIAEPGGRLLTHRVWYRYFQNLSDVIQYSPCIVANLPQVAAGVVARGFVTDSTGTTFYSTLTGGGASTVPVFFDGAVWRIG